MGSDLHDKTQSYCDPHTFELIMYPILGTVVEGDVITSEDAISTAECPKGASVMRCMTYGVPTASDGVVIENLGSTCQARSARNSPHSIQVSGK